MNNVLHLLPTFDTGGLGSLGLTMIRAWPEKARHLAIAPAYPATKPDLLGAFASLCGGGSVMQIQKNGYQPPPVWADLLAGQIARFTQGKPLHRVINYNFVDAVWNTVGVRKVGFSGPILAHVGTVIPDQKDTRLMAGSAHHYNTKFIPVSKAARERLVELGMPVERVMDPVWNGVDLPAYERPVRPKALTFGFSGRMPPIPVKDWKLLIEGFKLAGIPGASLRIAGDGPGRPAIEALAKGLPVEFVGNLAPAQIPEFLAGLDVFVMAALPIEGFSMAMVEAFASRCFLLGTDVPGVREPFAYGKGIKYLAKTPKALAKLMVQLQYTAEQEANAAFVDRVRGRLSAAAMAQTYYDAGA